MFLSRARSLQAQQFLPRQSLCRRRSERSVLSVDVLRDGGGDLASHSQPPTPAASLCNRVLRGDSCLSAELSLPQGPLLRGRGEARVPGAGHRCDGFHLALPLPSECISASLCKESKHETQNSSYATFITDQAGPLCLFMCLFQPQWLHSKSPHYLMAESSLYWGSQNWGSGVWPGRGEEGLSLLQDDWAAAGKL